MACSRSAVAAACSANLQTLDFHDLARAEQRVTELTRPGACMGNVYATTWELPMWNENLPLANAARQR